jgi:hypothetical protein
MKAIKLFFVGMAALVCSNVMAQKITAEAVTIAPGATEDLVFSVESEAAAALAEFELKLPTGLTVSKEYEAGELMSETHEVTISVKKKSGNTYVLIMSKEGDEFTAGSGKLISLKLTAAEDVAEGDYEIQMLKINLTSIEAKQMNAAEDETGVVKVTVGTADGINGIKAAENQAPSFNLAGQQVNQNYKGVVIKNGKKALVK